MQHDERAGARAVLLGPRLERRRVQHEGLGSEGGELVGHRVDEHRLGEEGVVRMRRDHADGNAVRRVSACKRVDDVELPLQREEVGHLVAQAIEGVLSELLVAVPPDALLGGGLAHDELVLRRAARVDAGIDRERTALGEMSLAVCDRVLIQQRGRRVPDHEPGCVDAVNREV